MKKIILIFSLISFINAYAQDIEMLELINKYRVLHNKKPLKVYDKLNNVAIKQNNLIMVKDSLFHSDLLKTIAKGEIIVSGKSLPVTHNDIKKFNDFLFKIFKIKLSDPINETEVITRVKLYIIYMYDQSPKHKSILLDDYVNIGFDTIIKDIKYTPNTVTILGKTVEYKNMVSHYKVNFYNVTTFN
jgi:hypothetical protein